MKMPYNQVKERVAEFAVQRVIPQIPSLQDRFLAGVGLGARIGALGPMLVELGVMEMDEKGEGAVDMDALSMAIETGFKSTPDGKYHFSHPRLRNDLVFSVSDWEDLKAHIMR